MFRGYYDETYISPITGQLRQNDRDVSSLPTAHYNDIRHNHFQNFPKVMSDKSSVLSPIIEESIQLTKSAPSTRTPQPRESRSSSISSFNVACSKHKFSRPVTILFQPKLLSYTISGAQNLGKRIDIKASIHEDKKDRAYSCQEAATVTTNRESFRPEFSDGPNRCPTCSQFSGPSSN